MLTETDSDFGNPVSTVMASDALNYCWVVDRGPVAIDRCASAWNELAHRGSLSPTAGALWMRCFWDAFGKTDNGLVVHSLYADDNLTTVLPLQRTGHMVRTWSSLTNAHTPYWMFAIDEERDDLGDLILDHLLATSDVISFERLHQNGPIFRMMTAAAHRRRLRNMVHEHGGDALLELPGSWEALRRSFSKKLRKNTERAERQLVQTGELTYATATGAAGVQAALVAVA